MVLLEFVNQFKELERIQEKHAPVKTGMDSVFRPNARPNKDLEHVRDSIFCERALILARTPSIWNSMVPDKLVRSLQLTTVMSRRVGG